MPKRRDDERGIQVNFIAWTTWQGLMEPTLLLIHANPMGGNRNAWEGAKLKEEGAKAGIPDLFLPHAARTKHGLFIEFKVPGKKPRKNQKEWISKLRAQGYAVFVCWSTAEAVCLVSWYLGIEQQSSYLFALKALDDKHQGLIREQFEANDMYYPYVGAQDISVTKQGF